MRVLLLPLGLTVLLLLAASASISAPAETVESEFDPYQLLEQAADLVVLRVPVEVPVHETLRGYVGGVEVTGRVQCWQSVGVDLQQAEVIEVDHANRVVHVRLPEPDVLDVRLDMGGSWLQTRRVGLWRVAIGEAHEQACLEQAWRVAERYFADMQLDQSLRSQALRRAERVIARVFGGSGWEVSGRSP